jgi:transcriptional regulator with XRE-family HTH domain
MPEATIREALGAMPHNEAAQRLGISPRQLRRIKHGAGKRAPHRSTRGAFLEVLGRDPWGTSATGQRDPERVALGRRLRARRRELGLTQQQVVDRARPHARVALAALLAQTRERLPVGPGLDMSVATVSRWENAATRGRWESAFALAIALDIDFDEWFGALCPQHMPDLPRSPTPRASG